MPYAVSGAIQVRASHHLHTASTLAPEGWSEQLQRVALLEA